MISGDENVGGEADGCLDHLFRRFTCRMQYAQCRDGTETGEIEEQEGHDGVVSLSGSHEDGEPRVSSERQLSQSVPVQGEGIGVVVPGVLRQFHPEFRCAVELVLAFRYGFPDGACVAPGDPCTQEDQQWEDVELSRPAGVQALLGDEIHGRRPQAGQAEKTDISAQPAVAQDEGQRRQQKDDHQRVYGVIRQVDESLQTLEKGDSRSEDLASKLKCALYGAFGPAELLAFEGVQLWWNLGRDDDIGQIQAFPALHLCPIAEVQVLAYCVGLPAARRVDASPAPYARRPVEVHEQPGSISGHLFDDKVAVQGDSLGPGQPGVVGVYVAPSRLNQSQVGAVQEIGNRAAQKIRLGDEIGVENGDKFPLRRGEAGIQRAGFEPRAVSPVKEIDVEALALVTSRQSFRQFGRFVGRFVLYLDVL